MKKLLLALLVFLLISNSPLSASAHNSTQVGILSEYYLSNYHDYYVGGEDVGWSIDEHFHTNGALLTYSFDNNDSNLTTAYKAFVNAGAALWAPTISVINKTDGSGVGKVCTTDNSVSGQVCYVAALSLDSADANGHFITWTMRMNTVYSSYFAADVFAHEFGHAIGLNDLYQDRNINKLMYYNYSCTATSPTNSDIWGAKVITGLHTSHSWAFKYYNYSSYGGNIHRKYCSDCNGNTDVIESCTYNNRNICIYCHLPYDFQPY